VYFVFSRKFREILSNKFIHTNQYTAKIVQFFLLNQTKFEKKLLLNKKEL